MDVFSFPMSDPSLTSLLLSTAAVAAAVGALVSAGVAALSDWRERVSRRKELLLSLAVDTANREITNFLKMIELTGVDRTLYPTVVMARWHQKQLKQLFDKEQLSDDLEKEFTDFIHKSHKTL